MERHAAQRVSNRWDRIGGSQPSDRGSIPRGAANSYSGRGLRCHALTCAISSPDPLYHLLPPVTTCYHPKAAQKASHLCTVSNLRFQPPGQIQPQHFQKTRGFPRLRHSDTHRGRRSAVLDRHRGLHVAQAGERPAGNPLVDSIAAHVGPATGEGWATLADLRAMVRTIEEGE